MLKKSIYIASILLAIVLTIISISITKAASLDLVGTNQKLNAVYSLSLGLELQGASKGLLSKTVGLSTRAVL